VYKNTSTLLTKTAGKSNKNHELNLPGGGGTGGSSTKFVAGMGTAS